MKITMKAVLISVDEQQKQAIDALMTTFCSAVRYSFKRLLGKKKIGDIEKDVAHRYHFNIRQAKDAVEEARQTIISQKELVKINYESAAKKVTAIEKKLKQKHLHDKKKNALMRKLDKRKRKKAYWERFLTEDTIPSVIFGTKKLFIKRCKGLITHQEWVDARTNRVYARGDRTKKGNPNLRVVICDNMSYLEISTLEKTHHNRAVKIQVPIYLPQKLSKKTGKVNGIPYRQMFLDHLAKGEAYQVEMIRKKGRYYCHITFELTEPEITYTAENGVIGIDTNPNGFALTLIDSKGNYKGHYYLKQHELLYARTSRRKNLCGELIKSVLDIAKKEGLAIAFEDLKFKDDKDVSSKFARIKHSFIYSQLLKMLEAGCMREGIQVIEVKPPYTSVIGLYKYCHQYGMDVHNGAAMVIARRSYGFKEKVPKILKDTFVKDKDIFDKQNEWKRWHIINKKIKEKEVKTPGFWIVNRKDILGINLPF